MVSPAHLVGISVGGMIAQAFALASPDRIASLTLIATASEFAEPTRTGLRDWAERLRRTGMAAEIDETMQRWFTAATREEHPDIVARATKTLLGDNPETHARLWEAVGNLTLPAASRRSRGRPCSS